MSIMQLRSMAQARLQHRAKDYGTEVIGKPDGIVTAWVADGWLDGYKACIEDVRAVIAKSNADTSDGLSNAEQAGCDVQTWLEEQR